MRSVVNSRNKKEFIEGINAGIPIFMGYFSISITFGLIAKGAKIPGYLAVLMSLTNFTGAAQFIGVNMFTQGIAIINIIFTTFMINTRYLLMSFCVANKLPNTVSKKIKALLAFGMVDEVFVTCMTRKNLKTPFMFGVQFISFTGWITGTVTGVLLASILPKSISSSINIAIYIMFLGLLLPAVKESLKVAAVTVIAVAISSVIYWVPFLNKLIGSGRIIITIITASLIGAMLFQNRSEDEIENEAELTA